jgi:hypothetical protein
MWLVIGFTFDRVFPSPTGQAEIFDFGVKGIVEGEELLYRIESSMVWLIEWLAWGDRCHGRLQWNLVLLRSDREWKDI